MSAGGDVVRKICGQALSGRGAHAETRGALGGLDWKLAGLRPEAVPHSIFQVVNHMIYWQEFALRWLDGQKQPTPEHASESWPGRESPVSVEEWDEAVEGFGRGLEGLECRAQQQDLLADVGGKTAMEIVQLVASHNSYHLGQVAFARRMMKAWPPPGGGATW